MSDLTKRVLNLFFQPSETICVSPNKFGYHSIKQEDIANPTLISPKGKVFDIYEDKINLLAVNPVNGFRKDENVTAFRSFLVEVDHGPLAEQKIYIESMNMPYSICVYSGNKSLHYGIVLDHDLPDIKVWKFYCEWILNIMKFADQQTNNPTRAIRFPGNLRNTEPFRPQALVDIKSRVSITSMNIWLNKFPECRPKPQMKPKTNYSPTLTSTNIPNWIKELLERGIDSDRNSTWYRVAAHFAERGTDFDNTIEFLENFYTEEKDFTRREWLTTITSAYKKLGVSYGT